MTATKQFLWVLSLFVLASCARQIPNMSFFKRVYCHSACDKEDKKSCRKVKFTPAEVHLLSTNGDYKKAFIVETWTAICGEYSGSSGNGFAALVKTDTGYVSANFWANELNVLKSEHFGIYDFTYHQQRTTLSYFVWWNGKQFEEKITHFDELYEGKTYEYDLIEKAKLLDSNALNNCGDYYRRFNNYFALDTLNIASSPTDTFFILKKQSFDLPFMLLKKETPLTFSIVNHFNLLDDGGYIDFQDSLVNGHKVLHLRDEKDIDFEKTPTGGKCRHFQIWQWDLVKKQYVFVKREAESCAD
jgi:hypothetical protein